MATRSKPTTTRTRRAGSSGDRTQQAAGRAATPERLAAPRQAKLDVRALRRGLGLTRQQFARLSGYSERSLAEWETSQAPRGAGLQRMAELRRLQQALARVIRPEFIGPWLLKPNQAFQGLKPLEVVERGEIDRLWQMIYLLESGEPS